MSDVAPTSPLDRLAKSARKPSRLIVGLLSGTSVDAAEAALCHVSGAGSTVKLELVAHRSLPFPAALRASVLAAQTPQELCALNFALGEIFAEAAEAVLAAAGVAPEALDLVGSHGQTVAHLPPPEAKRPSTLQLGEPSLIAERLRTPVICNFRVRDMAVGGQGAPLIPYMDWALFRKPGVTRAFQNLGGIGNVSVVGERLEDTLAFDTGPGNMLLDGLAERITHGALTYDRDGELSRQGSVDPALLEFLMANPYLRRPPPKSTGRELLGRPLLEAVWQRGRARPFDAIATAVAFTVEATALAYERFVLPRFQPEAVFVSGGGSRHPLLMAGLTQRLAPLAVERLNALGFPEAAKEAACFALLANEWLFGVPANVRSATGAHRQVVLGQMVP